MLKTTTFLTTLAVAGAFALGACGEGQDEGELAEPLPEETGMPDVPGLDEEPATGPVEVGLEAKAESGVTGTATVTPIADGVEVALDVDGLTDGQIYPAHLHRGSCDEDMGVVAPLEDVTAAGETGRSTTTIGGSMLDPTAESLFIQVHGTDGSPIACGNVPAEAGLTELAPTGAIEQPATGTDEYR